MIRATRARQGPPSLSRTKLSEVKNLTHVMTMYFSVLFVSFSPQTSYILLSLDHMACACVRRLSPELIGDSASALESFSPELVSSGAIGLGNRFGLSSTYVCRLTR